MKDIPEALVPQLQKAIPVTVRFAEKAAPEAFRWLGWSAAIAVLEVVRQKTGAHWILAIDAVLYLLILGRIQWSTGYYSRMSELFDDGSFEQKPRRQKMLTGLFAVACWILTSLVSFYLPYKVAESELLQDVSPALLSPSAR